MSAEIRISPKKLIIEHEAQSPDGRGRFYLRAPADHTIEQVLDPAYFGQCTEREKALRECDLIEVESEDRSWELTLTVLSVSKDTRRVVTRLKGEIARYDVAISKEHADAGYSLKFINREAGWAVLLGKDVVAQGYKTQTRAAERLKEITPEKATKKAA